MEEAENKEEIVSEKKIVQRVGQEQIHGLLFEPKLSWQAIIYDLINSEQLDPWDIDLSLLANKYLERVRLLEEANFYVSSQVLLAAAILLRLKSDHLLNYYIPSIDDRLFGRKEEVKKYNQERIELDEEIPELVVRTPLPRFQKISLDELMSALGQAINTENRRIKKVVVAKQQEFETAISLPRRKINLRDQINHVYSRLRKVFKEREEKLAFTEFIGNGANNEDRVATFVPLLHLDNQRKVWTEQDVPFEEIWIWLKEVYEKKNAVLLEQMRKESEEAMMELTEEEKKLAKKVEEDYQNPAGDGEEEDEKSPWEEKAAKKRKNDKEEE